MEQSLTAEYIGRRLDYLTKELERYNEHRRIQAMVELAHRIRQERETAEHARRAGEIKEQQENRDQLLRVMGIHVDTVETYLEDIILESMDIEASQQARKRVREIAEQLDKASETVG